MVFLATVIRMVGRLSFVADAVVMTRAELPEFPEEPVGAIRRHPKYHSHLVSLMAYTLSQNFEPGQLFGVDALRSLTPFHIVRWMNNKAFGRPDPDYNVDRPTECRTSTIEYMKKAISWYMPDHQQWTTATNPPSGNPTKSRQVLALLGHMRKAEVQGNGRTPQSRRDFTMQEFCKIITLLREKRDFVSVWKYPTMLAWQFSLIGRGDDVAHLETLHVTQHPGCSFALQTKVSWSKNVNDERECPPQILLGAMNDMFCVLLNTGVYLECWLEQGNGDVSPYLFTEKNDAKSLVRVYRAALKNVYEDAEFVALASLLGGLLGIHGIRKFAATYAKSVGRPAEEIDVRARWKRLGGRMIGRYIAVDQPIVDTVVCQALCVGGAIEYRVCPEAGFITDAWLVENVCPSIHTYYSGGSKSVAPVLAKAVLWGCMDPEVSQRIPPELVLRVRSAYDSSVNNTVAHGVNPILRIGLHAFRNEDTLVIHETGPQRNEGPGPNPDPDQGEVLAAEPATPAVVTPIAASHQAYTRHADLQAVATVTRLQQGLVDRVMGSIQELKQRITNSDHSTQAIVRHVQLVVLQEMEKINKNVCRIAVQPPRMATPAQAALIANTTSPQRCTVVRPPTLQKNIRCLGVLWQEWLHGVGGSKAAKDFTPEERGHKQNCSRFSRRLPIWLLISKLVNAGVLAPEAIRRIEAQYGPKVSIISLGSRIKADIKANRLHQSLRF